MKWVVTFLLLFAGFGQSIALRADEKPSVSGSCPKGKILKNGLCCWPGQDFGFTTKKCIGNPQCPDDMKAENNECIYVGCQSGKILVGGHCCWPGQDWGVESRRCMGEPNCPPMYTKTEEDCKPPSEEAIQQKKEQEKAEAEKIRRAGCAQQCTKEINSQIDANQANSCKKKCDQTYRYSSQPLWESCRKKCPDKITTLEFCISRCTQIGEKAKPTPIPKSKSSNQSQKTQPQPTSGPETSIGLIERTGFGLSGILGVSLCIKNGDASCSDLDPSFGFSLSPNYRLTDYFGLELDFIYGKYDVTAYDASGMGLLIGPVLYLPLLPGPIDLFAGVGIGWIRYQLGYQNQEGNIDGFGIGLHAGFEYRINRYFGLGVAFRLNFNTGDEICDDDDNCFELEDVQHNAIIGARWSLYF